VRKISSSGENSCKPGKNRPKHPIFDKIRNVIDVQLM